MELASIVGDFATTLKELDSARPVASNGRFRPGVGPLPESEVISRVLQRLALRNPAAYRGSGSLSYPGTRSQCDIVILGHWAIEVKLARPFGDNGKPAERWAENLLYPYPGNTSSIGDSLKLLESGFAEQKAVLVVGYEHATPQIPLEPAVHAFEVIASDVVGIKLGPRVTAIAPNLVRPVHQQATVFAWAVLSRQAPHIQDNNTVPSDSLR